MEIRYRCDECKAFPVGETCLHCGNTATRPIETHTPFVPCWWWTQEERADKEAAYRRMVRKAVK